MPELGWANFSPSAVERLDVIAGMHCVADRVDRIVDRLSVLADDWNRLAAGGILSLPACTRELSGRTHPVMPQICSPVG
ncbi:MAG TPA: hypothetical protein VH763_16590 [Gemmatimonadales bacterium]